MVYLTSDTWHLDLSLIWLRTLNWAGSSQMGNRSRDSRVACPRLEGHQHWGHHSLAFAREHHTKQQKMLVMKQVQPLILQMEQLRGPGLSFPTPRPPLFTRASGRRKVVTGQGRGSARQTPFSHHQLP